VPAELVHHLEAVLGGHMLDLGADGAHAGAGPTQRDGLVQRLLRGLDEPPRALALLSAAASAAAKDGAAVVAVEAVDVERDVDAHLVPAAHHAVVRDAVAHHLVHGRADGLGEAPVVQGGWVGPVPNDLLAGQLVYLVGGVPVRLQGQAVGEV